jgi:hypothetical protein
MDCEASLNHISANKSKVYPNCPKCFFVFLEIGIPQTSTKNRFPQKTTKSVDGGGVPPFSVETSETPMISGDNWG